MTLQASPDVLLTLSFPSTNVFATNQQKFSHYFQNISELKTFDTFEASIMEKHFKKKFARKMIHYDFFTAVIQLDDDLTTNRLRKLGPFINKKFNSKQNIQKHSRL